MQASHLAHRRSVHALSSAVTRSKLQTLPPAMAAPHIAPQRPVHDPQAHESSVARTTREAPGMREEEAPLLISRSNMANSRYTPCSAADIPTLAAIDAAEHSASRNQFARRSISPTTSFCDQHGVNSLTHVGDLPAHRARDGLLHQAVSARPFRRSSSDDVVELTCPIHIKRCGIAQRPVSPHHG